jgi:hypothetical protein
MPSELLNRRLRVGPKFSHQQRHDNEDGSRASERNWIGDRIASAQLVVERVKPGARSSSPYIYRTCHEANCKRVISDEKLPT